jgi:hypothetical protein
MKRRILELRPTQFAVGMKEVDRRIGKFQALSEKKLDAYLRRHPVPVVVGPGRIDYLVDGHHHARSCWEAGHRDIFVDIQADKSEMLEQPFWAFMRRSHWAHLYDEFGGGPHEPQRLPEDIRGLADDPYRSLAWAVRREGGYDKSSLDFAEFKWADFFRKKIPIAQGADGFKKAVKAALRLCRSDKGRLLRLALALIFCALPARARAAEEAPKRWEQLFYPFPIVGAPPQLEQQVQFFGSYFTGDGGHAYVPAVEVGYVATAHVGLVATVPYQSGGAGQPSGVGDSQFLIQYLTAGSLEDDSMLSLGIQSGLPTGRPSNTSGDYFIGPFAYGAKRFRKRLIFEANATPLIPLTRRASAKQLALDGLVSYLLDPGRALPVYAQAEATGNFYFAGTAALPPGQSSAPAQTAALGPEIFLGPFDGPFGDGTRVVAGVLFNIVGDPVHERTYSLSVAFDLPNRFGY